MKNVYWKVIKKYFHDYPACRWNQDTNRLKSWYNKLTQTWISISTLFTNEIGGKFWRESQFAFRVASDKYDISCSTYYLSRIYFFAGSARYMLSGVSALLLRLKFTIPQDILVHVSDQHLELLLILMICLTKLYNASCHSCSCERSTSRTVANINDLFNSTSQCLTMFWVMWAINI